MKDELHRAIDAVWRIESAKVVASVARVVRDVAVAEELAQDALISAVEHWPVDGLPDKPGAWLMTTAKHRALDWLRQDALHRARQEELGADADARGDHVVPDFSDALDAADDIEDDLLRLIFTACHPVLPREAQLALTLKVVAGLSSAEIARAFLAPEPTIAQRIVRAKRLLSAAKVPFEVPRGEELTQRLASVLAVIYLIFNEGYAASAGDDWMRPTLCEEALRLARMLSALMPKDSEVFGLLALLEIQASRTAARIDAGGQPILLLDQNRSRWDQLLIHRGLVALEAARRCRVEPGPYELQAAIAACHARARAPHDTNWQQIVTYYDELAHLTQSPVVLLNRAVAVGMADGPQAALELVDALAGEPALQRYHLLGAVRGDLLVKLGRSQEAALEFERAAAQTLNTIERKILLDRAIVARREKDTQ